MKNKSNPSSTQLISYILKQIKKIIGRRTWLIVWVINPMIDQIGQICSSSTVYST
jgi:hypothetical protein